MTSEAIKKHILLTVCLALCNLISIASTQQTFKLVKSIAELNNGDVVIVVNTKNGFAMSTYQDTNNRGQEAITIEDETIATSNDAIQRITIEYDASGKCYYLATGENLYLCNNSTSDKQNYLITGNKSNASKTTITIDDNANATICFPKQSTPKTYEKCLGYNVSSKIFSCYNSISFSDDNRRIQIYKLTDSRKTTYTSFTGSDSYDIEQGDEDTFVSPQASVKDAENNIIENAVIKYASSNTSVATVDENTGVVTINSNNIFGTTTITAEYAGDDNYSASSASYMINYKEKTKTQTALSFGNDIDGKTFVVYKGKESNFTNGKKATLSPSEAGNITYRSTNEEVATVDGNGTITFKELGKTEIIAEYTGNDNYEKSSASYFILYKTEALVFSSEINSFTNVPEGDNYTTQKTSFDFIANDGNSYSFTTNKVKRQNMLLIVGSSTSITSPKFPKATNGYKVTVKYYQTASSASSKMLTISSGNVKATATADKASEQNETKGTGFIAELEVPDTKAFTITSGNIAYISEIEVRYTVNNISLDEAIDNSQTIKENIGNGVDITLTRKLVADKWNTFCVPFNIYNAKDILPELGDIESFDRQEGNIMHFKSTQDIVAGHPYLIKPTKDIENPTFKDVVITASEPVEVGNETYKFVGVYSPKTFSDDEAGTSLFLTSDNQLFTPIANTTMKGMRAYFIVPSDEANAGKITLDSDETTIESISLLEEETSNAIFNLNGIRLNKMPQKGVYIKNGRKFVVK